MTTIDEARAALVAALSEMVEPPLDAKGEAGGGARYAYTTLSGLLNHARPVLARHGLALYLSTECAVGADGVGTATATARIVHAAGEVASSASTMPVLAMVRRDGSVVAPGAQSYGSALTYARRYAAYGVLGVGGETDNDGAAIRDAEQRGKTDAASAATAQKPATAAAAASSPRVVPPPTVPVETGEREPATDGITEPQKKRIFAMVRALAPENTSDDEIRAVCTAQAQGMFKKTVSGLSKKEASAVMDWLSEADWVKLKTICLFSGEEVR